MGNVVPTEIQKQIEEFKKSDPGWQKDYQKNFIEIKIPHRGGSAEVKKIAKMLGFEIQSGGRESLHIVKWDEEEKKYKYVTSLPDHPGDLATGTYQNILSAMGIEKLGKKVRISKS
jgi:hypothetical protein